jgi:hypothetical protein
VPNDDLVAAPLPDRNILAAFSEELGARTSPAFFTVLALTVLALTFLALAFLAHIAFAIIAVGFASNTGLWLLSEL